VDKNELVKLLLSSNFPNDSYSVDEVLDESLCLIYEGSIWKVFYSERGHRTEEQSYVDEAQACEVFFKRLKHMLGH
jgi:hypothetical protein